MSFIIGLLHFVDVRRKQWQGRAGEVPRQKNSLQCRSGPGTSCGNTSEASTRGGGVEKRAFPSLIGNTAAVDSGRDGRDASRDKFVTSR
jgi:hypothetical protein